MPPATPLELLREAMAATRASDKPKTRRLLIEATRLDPKNETAWQWLAGVAESPLEATVALERVLALNPDNEKAKAAIRPARLQAGIAAAKAKDAPTARKLLRAFVAEEPGNEHGWLWLASIADSPADALLLLDRVLAINPLNPTAKKGVEFYRAKRDAAAKEATVDPTDNTPPPSDATLPLGPAAARRPLPPPAPPRPKTVLVVDDSRTIRKLAAMTMNGAGYRVIEAEDGSNAVDQIREYGVPDLILLDVAMPGMDGFEFCRTIRLNPDTKRVPVVMLTGKDGFFDKIRGKLAGTSAYLAKPLNPDVLLKTVRKYIPAAASAD